MIYFILGAIVYFVPNLWVNYTLNKHNDILPNMPFSAKEFGEELLKEKGLDSNSSIEELIDKLPMDNETLSLFTQLFE